MTEQRGAFIWYELMTPDPVAAKQFYDAVIGWSIDPANSGPDGSMDYRMINRTGGGHAGGVMGLSQEMLAGGAKPGWLGYVHVPDVDAAAAAMTAAGGAIHMPPRDMPGVGRMAMVADPWGAALYLMTPTPPPGNPDAVSDVFSADQPQRVRWNELWSADPAGAVTLYGELFGWTQDGAMPMGELGDYRFIQHGTTTIGAISPVMPGGAGPRWNYYIGVDDIDRAMAAVDAGGGTLLGEAHEIPGGEFSAHARDPHGADFGMVGPRLMG